MEELLTVGASLASAVVALASDPVYTLAGLVYACGLLDCSALLWFALGGCATPPVLAAGWVG